MPFTMNARRQSTQKPRKKCDVPPCRYVFSTQSHTPLYFGFAGSSAIIFDLITSNGNTHTQLNTPKNDKPSKTIVAVHIILYNVDDGLYEVNSVVCIFTEREVDRSTHKFTHIYELNITGIFVYSYIITLFVNNKKIKTLRNLIQR